MEILKRYKELLSQYNSDKDPYSYHYKRKLFNNDSLRNRCIIVNFTDEDNRFGCQFTCKFCSWRKEAIRIGEINPSKEDIENFLNVKNLYKVTVSGGGEPLYKLEKNYIKLSSILDHIHKLGFITEVITKDVNTVISLLKSSNEKNFKNLTEQEETILKIDCYSFSIESFSNKLFEGLEILNSLKIPFRISKVISPGLVNKEKLIKYMEYSKLEHLHEIILREDFNNNKYSIDERLDLFDILDISKKVKFLKTSDCQNNFFLVNDEIKFGKFF